MYEWQRGEAEGRKGRGYVKGRTILVESASKDDLSKEERPSKSAAKVERAKKTGSLRYNIKGKHTRKKSSIQYRDRCLCCEEDCEIEQCNSY